jgi:hypothetical protein
MTIGGRKSQVEDFQRYLEKGPNCLKENGRHEETRTPDLYRVKVAL